MSQKVIIERSGDHIRVQAPYNTEFVSGARLLSGRWDAPVWLFDARNEQWVRDLAFEVYGQDGERKDVCSMRVEWIADRSKRCGPIELYGRILARASGRDTGARLGDDVVLLQGRVGSGGSLQNWRTTVSQGTVMIVRDFPRAIAESWSGDRSGGCVCTIEPEASPPSRPTTAELESERARLLARIAEIDATLPAVA